PNVDAAIARALTLRPAERFQSARDLARALSMGSASGAPTLLGAPVSSPPAPSRPPWQPAATPSSLGVAGSAPTARRQPPPNGTRPLTPIPSPAPPTPPGMAVSRPGNQASDVRLHPERVGKSATLTGSPAAAPRATGALNARAGTRQSAGRRPFYRSPLMLGSGLACVVLVVAVIAVLVLNATAPPDRSSPQATVTGYFAALKAQNYSLAWRYVSQSRTNVSVESSFVNDLQSDDARLGRVLTAHMTALDTSSGQVSEQVDVTRALSPGTTLSYSLDLSQFDNDTWLITSISSTS
ncbi:MAG: hypothetical protein ACRDHP_08490, partial [Ktedonobacterales bacterium]